MARLMDKSRFTQLVEALQTGWEIEEPVLLGTTWRNKNEQDGVYHFILRNRIDDKTTMVSLPPSPNLLVFLHENNITINSL